MAVKLLKIVKTNFRENDKNKDIGKFKKSDKCFFGGNTNHKKSLRKEIEEINTRKKDHKRAYGRLKEAFRT